MRTRPTRIRRAARAAAPLLFAAAPLLLAVACGGGKSVRPDDMSAEAHYGQAAKEHAQAEEHLAQHDPKETRRVGVGPAGERRDPWSGPFIFPVEVYNPGDWHLAEAERHSLHAREHEEAAAALERFEEAECRDFPPATRAACPILAVARVDDVRGGVRITLRPGVDVDAVVAHMRCHFAYARARAFVPDSTCPLYVRGVEIARGADGRSVDLLSADPQVELLLRRETRAAARATPAGHPLPAR